MHVPAVTKVAFMPLIVQMPLVSEKKLTAKSELAVADRISGVATVCVPGALNVMVCGSAFTVKLRETGVAASNVVLPAWEA